MHLYALTRMRDTATSLSFKIQKFTIPNDCEYRSIKNVLLHPFRYDPKTDTWTLVAPISIPRDAVGVSLLGDKLYAVGGYDGQSYLKEVECYDAQSNEWTKVGKKTQLHGDFLFSLLQCRISCMLG